MIKYITENDREEFIQMMTEFFSTPAVLHSLPHENFVKTFNECISDSPYAKAIIAKHDGKAAGYMQISFTYSNEVAGLVAWIEELYVRDEFRGKGIGKALVEFLRKEYDNKVKRYRLEVSPDNVNIMELYKKLGFQKLDYVQMTLDLD